MDAYDASERALSWYYYLEEKLKFPFAAECILHFPVLNLKKGQRVSVLSLAPEDYCTAKMMVVI